MRESVRRPATSIKDLDFADDIALLENSLEQSQLQLQYTSHRAKEVGLEANIKKTETMTNQAKNGTIKLDGETIKWVENFKYLGSMMLSSETDIKIRKGQAWGAFWKMKDIWKSMKYNEKIMKLGKSALNKNTKQEPKVRTIQRRQFRFIGHCLRRDKEEFTYQYALYTTA